MGIFDNDDEFNDDFMNRWEKLTGLKRKKL